MLKMRSGICSLLVTTNKEDTTKNYGKQKQKFEVNKHCLQKKNKK